MADEEGSEDTLLDSILEEEGGEQEQAAPETEEEESAEAEGGEQETEEGAESEETEAEGGEGPGDEEESEEGEEDQGERTQPSRGQSRIQRLNEERNRLRAENEELRRRAGGGGGQGGAGDGGRTQAPTPQAIRENVKKSVQEKLGPDFSVLAPDQQADRLLGAMEAVLQPVIRGLQGNQFASNDKAQFYEDRRGNRWVERNKGEIERRFQAALAQGYTVPREQIARDMAGEQALTGIQKGGGSARRQASNRKAAARGTPTRGRGDTKGSSRMSEMQQLEKRLEDVKI